MDNGDPCFVSVAQTGVLVKKSKIGWFAAVLYRKAAREAANTAMTLSLLYPIKLTPGGMINPALIAFTNAILRCSTIGEATRVLNDPESVAADDETIIHAYGAAMGRTTRMISDVGELPAAKVKIAEALLRAIVREPNPDMRERLKVGYIELASFQAGAKDVGSGNVNLSMSPAEVVQAIPPKELMDMMTAEQMRRLAELRKIGL